MATPLHLALPRCLLGTILLLGFSLNVIAQIPEIHCKQFIFGYPTGTPASNDLIIRDSYALSSNDTTKFADWVAYRLTPYEVTGTLDLDRKWRTDPWLEVNETLEATPSSADDYRKASDEDYDRGHLAPLASFKGSRDASQVDYYSNIVPQKKDLNEGSWQKLEQIERNIVCSGEMLWVMTGPLYESQMAPLPQADEPHTVPSGFWKILVLLRGNGPWVAAFIFGQDTPRDSPVAGHLVSVDEIEARSHLDFFRELPSSLENSIEATALTTQQWQASLPEHGCPQSKP
jgi:endonuclease G